MRKHFYLVTEHEDETRQGGVSVYDSRRPKPLKNNEGGITVLDEETEGFRDVGRMVGLGYYDFDSEVDYEDRVAEVMKAKIREVDREWAEKAGVVDTVYDND